jgi:hypothetical protein
VKAPAVHFNRDGRPRCGARPKVPLLADGESGVTCGHCTAHLNGTYGIGSCWYDPKPCGTPAAYRRHKRHGERIDESCRQAEARRSADDKARRNAARRARRQRRNQKGLAA